MFKCLIISQTPLLYDVLTSIDSFKPVLEFTSSMSMCDGFDIIITDAQIKPMPKENVILVDSRPIELSEVLLQLDKFIAKHNQVLSFAGINLDISSRTLSVDDVKIQLTEIESKILAAMLVSKSRALGREEIKTAILGYSEDTQTNTIENHIYHLRIKLAHCTATVSIQSIESGYIITTT